MQLVEDVDLVLAELRCQQRANKSREASSVWPGQPRPPMPQQDGELEETWPARRLRRTDAEAIARNASGHQHIYLVLCARADPGWTS